MEQDSIRYDSLSERPLPKWLTDQKQGLNAYQPKKIIIKEDRSLEVSFIFTGLIIILVISALTIFVLRKKKKTI